MHLPEAIDRDLFKVFDTKSYQKYLFLESTGIAHCVQQNKEGHMYDHVTINTVKEL